MESYNENNQTYSELYNSKYGIMSEHSFDKTVVFYPASEEQSLLYNKSHLADLKSYYFSASLGFVVLFFFPCLTIGYGTCYFLFSNTKLVHQIFYYLYGMYGI